MKVFFTDHVRQKMEERKIPREKVLETIHHPSFTRPTYSSREERYKKFGRNYLMVVVRQEEAELIVITAHWVGKLPKG